MIRFTDCIGDIRSRLNRVHAEECEHVTAGAQAAAVVIAFHPAPGPRTSMCWWCLVGQRPSHSEGTTNQ